MLTGPALYTGDMARMSRQRQIVALLSLDHPDLAEPIHVVSDTLELTVGGVTYQAFPFDFQLPGEREAVPECRITVQNVDKAIGAAIRGLHGAPVTATIAAVLRDDPATPIVDVPLLRLRDVEVTSAFVSGTLAGRAYANSAWPGIRATPELTPGLHWT